MAGGDKYLVFCHTDIGAHLSILECESKEDDKDKEFAIPPNYVEWIKYFLAKSKQGHIRKIQSLFLHSFGSFSGSSGQMTLCVASDGSNAWCYPLTANWFGLNNSVGLGEGARSEGNWWFSWELVLSFDGKAPHTEWRMTFSNNDNILIDQKGVGEHSLADFCFSLDARTQGTPRIGTERNGHICLNFSIKQNGLVIMRSSIVCPRRAAAGLG